MSIIRLNNVSKYYEEKPVLREVYFRLSQGDRVGLIGKNGAGKTTLLKLILGLEKPNGGTVDIDQGTRIGYFSQFSELDGAVSVQQELDKIFSEIHTLEERLLEIEIALESPPSGEELDRLLSQQATVLEQIEHKDGWNYQYKIDTVLSRLGFSNEHRACSINQLSGGWKNRAALAKILLENPDVLLMDEPTNFLDLEGLTWLEEWLNAFRGALLIVSHDRHFIDRAVNRVIEIENYHLQEYTGNYTDYIREKPLRLKTLERQYEHEEELLALEAEAISDRLEALKDPTQALKRRLSNVKKNIQPRSVDDIITALYEKLYVPSNLCTGEGLTKTYNDRALIRQLSFEIHRGDRIAIVGPNGCGKTTLLRMLAEEITPDQGHIVWKKGAAYVHFNQVFDELDVDDTVTHAVNIVELAYLAQRKQVNRFLSLMQFSENDLHQRIQNLSGGQRARVALAKSLLSGASVILLDEPTNHLDVTSTQVMERALAHFPGSIVVISHDRFFIDKIATQLFVFEGSGTIRKVNGTWTTWHAGVE